MFRYVMELTGAWVYIYRCVIGLTGVVPVA